MADLQPRNRWDDLPEAQLTKVAETSVRKILDTVKAFDEEEPDTLQAWLDDLEIAFSMAGITAGASKNTVLCANCRNSCVPKIKERMRPKSLLETVKDSY
ncbi:hypothetical protein MPER_10867 [Moniliophthora perniciosa FA553]|nr:hypothetical protein MPER_10867 [Moniliophthora perniciosa FA553]